MFTDCDFLVQAKKDRIKRKNRGEDVDDEEL